MRLPALSFPVLLVVGALGAAPTDTPPTRVLRVTITAPKEAAAGITGTVTLKAVMAPQSPVALPVASLDKPLMFTVPARTMWETAVTIKGWWAPPIVVAVQDEDTDVTLTLLPTGTVTGRLVAPEGGAKAEVLFVNVDVPPGAKQLPGPPSAQTPCALVGDSAFSCEVPAGTLDLSFHARGYVPVYKWGVAVTKGTANNLGRLSLSQGSALSGFIVLAGKKIEPTKGKVALFIEAPGASPTAFRLSRPVAQTATAPNGFFQFTDVPPGRYVLQATYPGFAEATVSPVEILASVETKLKRAIELQPPVTLTLRVDPPTDYNGKDWLFRVRRASAVNNRYVGTPLFDGPAHDGVVVLRGQPGGRYSVAIGDASGNPFVAEEFTTAGVGDETHTFHPEFVKIKGTLHRGEEPLAATIWFGGRFGDKHVALRSNDRGEFHGVLPHAGYWPVTVSTAAIETQLAADVAKTDADKDSEVELKVPANHVEGIVVDSNDKPLVSAYVRFNTDSDFGVMHRTDPTGRFAFDGVKPGPFTLAAEYETPAGLQASEPHAATIGESDSINGITLKVHDGRSLHGRVIGSAGPVIGADVTISPGDGLNNAPQTNATTGPAGIFDSSIAAGFDRALMAVEAPGYALRVFDVPLDGRAFTLNVPQGGGTLYVTPPTGNGVFLFQDGRLLSLGTLIRWASSRGESITDGKTLRVSEMAPARYRACAYKPGETNILNMTRCAEGFLPPFGELRLTIQ